MPVIARACAWSNISWLKHMDIRPSNGVPIWNTRWADECLAAIAEEVIDVSEKESDDYAHAHRSDEALNPQILSENTIQSLDDSADSEDYAVPWFFQSDAESAMKEQINWLTERLGLDDHFFSKLLNMEVNEFRKWRNENNVLSQETKNMLREFWQMILHLLSYLSFDTELVQTMLSSEDKRERRSIRLPFDPPWIGTSIKEYLKASGPAGISEVSRWVLSFRFADRHQIDTQNRACP